MTSNTKVVDKSNSYISNLDIWNDNNSPDNSKVFIENFNNMNDKNVSSFSKVRNIVMSKKPKHLSVILRLIIKDSYSSSC